jgi:MFS family permease
MEEKLSNKKLLAHAEFRHFLLSRLFFVLGLRMFGTITAYELFTITNSTYYIGLGGLAEFIPALITALFAGTYVDRHNKKNIVLYGYVFFFIALLIIFYTSKMLSPHTQLYVVLMVLGCSGVMRSFVGPASNGMLAAIVPTAWLTKATTFNSTTWLTSSIAGHALGGFCIAGVGIAHSYLVAAAFVLLGLYFAIKLLPKPATAAAKAETLSQALKQGFSFVYNHKTIYGVLCLDLFAVLFGGAVAFIPEVSTKILQAGPIAYGWLNAAIDIGGLLSMIYLIFKPLLHNQGRSMLIAVFVFGACIIVFGLSKVYWLSFLALLVAGFADGISIVVRGSILQLYTPNELRGRVSAINSIFINSSNELGQFESGITAKMFGTKPAIIIGGSLTMLVVFIIRIVFKNLHKIHY